MSNEPDRGRRPAAHTLVVRRFIAASPERLFDAYTQAQELRQWWGPESVRCTAAELDLRVGGTYHIANQMPDGSTLWIDGEFEHIERPHKLVFTWRIGANAQTAERVTVSFVARSGGTEVTVTHERIADVAILERHRAGWEGCLAGLDRHLARRA